MTELQKGKDPTQKPNRKCRICNVDLPLGYSAVLCSDCMQKVAKQQLGNMKVKGDCFNSKGEKIQ